MVRPVFRPRAVILAWATIISAPTVACAEPLFFDCHGTTQHERPDGMKIETAEQIMIDLDKGVIEGTHDVGTLRNQIGEVPSSREKFACLLRL